MSYAVTIGIPVYNAHKFIGRALDTALSQTFTNLEVLIVDDCSTDDTLTIIEQYQKTHQRGNCIRVLRQEKNGGPSAARNRMIDEARGHFLYFMDVDDTIPVFAIATLYDAAVGYRAEVVYGSHKHVEMYDKRHTTSLFQYPLRVFQKKGELASYAYLHYGKFQVPVWNVLINVFLSLPVFGKIWLLPMTWCRMSIEPFCYLSLLIIIYVALIPCLIFRNVTPFLAVR